MSHAAEEGAAGPLTATERLAITLSEVTYTVADNLHLDRLRDLLLSAELDPHDQAVLLGEVFNAGGGGRGGGGGAAASGCDADADAAADAASRREMERLLRALTSLPWMSYRRGFAPLDAGGGVALTSDAGWGCTLRSGQMLVAAALARARLGRGWRWDAAAPPPHGVPALLRLFWDAPSDAHPLSLHALCAHGAPYGVAPGRWVGPWALCRALAAAAACSRVPLGLSVSVVASDAGAVPVLYAPRLEAHFSPAPNLPSGGAARGGPPPAALLLLVPLVLGPDRQVHPRYVPQLAAALAAPQSAGLVGGRPGASLFVAGAQGGAALVLDPHSCQPAVRGAGAGAGAGAADPGHLGVEDEERDDGEDNCAAAAAWAATYRSDALRTLALGSLDPSLALGFLCTSARDAADLVGRLEALEAAARGAPLVSVSRAAGPAPPPAAAAGGGRAVEAWEDVLGSDGGASGGGGSGGGGGEGLPPARSGSGWELL